MFSLQCLTDSYCHHLCQLWGAEWRLHAPGVWIPPPGPSLQRQVHSIGDKAQLVVKCPGFEHIKIGQTGVFQEHSFLTQVMMSHHWLYLDIIWDSSFWNVWRNILRRNRKGLTGAWWSQGFLCKLQHLKFSFIKDIAHRSDTKNIVVAGFSTCKQRNLPLFWYSPPAVWPQPCANNSTEASLLYFSCLFHSSASFSIVPLHQEKLILEKLSYIGNGPYIQLHFSNI